MAEELLRGNFEVKNPVRDKMKAEEVSVRKELKKRVLASLGGSMVYMERNSLIWDGEHSDARDDS